METILILTAIYAAVMSFVAAVLSNRNKSYYEPTDEDVINAIKKQLSDNGFESK